MLCFFFPFYRSQRSCWKVMLSRMSVILFWAISLVSCLGESGALTPLLLTSGGVQGREWGPHPPLLLTYCGHYWKPVQPCSLEDLHPYPDQYWYLVTSAQTCTCGRYASYCNAFLFEDVLILPVLLPAMKLRQGDVFTPVCDSVHREGLCPSMHHRSHDQGRSLSRRGSLSRKGSLSRRFSV